MRACRGDKRTNEEDNAHVVNGEEEEGGLCVPSAAEQAERQKDKHESGATEQWPLSIAIGSQFILWERSCATAKLHSAKAPIRLKEQAQQGLLPHARAHTHTPRRGDKSAFSKWLE